MIEQNENILKRAFPTIYRKDFYFECGDGWFELLSRAASYIARESAHCYVAEAKEKFGKLRIYVDFEIDKDGYVLAEEEARVKIYDILRSIEDDSKNICEYCGISLEPSNRESQKNMGYWIKNICKDCFVKAIKAKDR